MDQRGVQAWLDRYIEAWRTYDEGSIAALFARDAEYRYHPADDPVVGPEAIAASWTSEPDDPESWDAWYHPYLVEGDRAVATGVSTYFDGEGNAVRVFDNVYLLAFDEDGRCSRFTEWYIQRGADQVDKEPPIAPS
jgi:hypothetical protein